MPTARERNRVLATAGIPEVEWADVAGEFMAGWDQGQHLSVTGRTGSGKTALCLHLLDRAATERGANCVTLGTKLRDRTLVRTGWPIVTEWPPTFEQLTRNGTLSQTNAGPVIHGSRVVAWPPYASPAVMRAQISALMDQVLHEGGWRFHVDEMAYLIQTLNLRTEIDTLFNVGRSSGLSMICSSQRPVWGSRSGMSQTEWSISFPVNDMEDRKRAAELLGDRNRFAPALGALGDEHNFILVHTLTGNAVVTRLPKEVVR